MDIVRLIENDKNLREEYEYYLSLGFGHRAASVMTVLDYGDIYIAAFVKSFPKEGVLNRIYDWIWSLENVPTDVNMAAYDYVKSHFDDIPDELKEELRPRLFPDTNIRNTYASSTLFGGAIAGGAVMTSAPAFGGMMAMAAGGAVNGSMMAAPGFVPGMSVKIDPEKFATDTYALIEEKDAKSVLTAPTSTFRMTTSTASVGIMLNQKNNDRKIDISHVRIEELLNYFDYDHVEANAAKDATFKINTELLDKGNDRKLLYIHVEADATPKEHQNIVLLLDTSGSMATRHCVTFETLATIVSKLNEGDVLSLVTYSTIDHTILTNHVVKGRADREDLMGEILGIWIDGSTNGSAGIETAYAIGEKTYRDGWSNQVILMTDGDLNFGINTKGGLQKLIEEKKMTGMCLSVIGTGLYNYQDEKLETLSKHGNGTYCVVNDLDDVKESIDRKYVSLTNIVAKDVKAQVEFNPKYVSKYRLLGYENRSLNHEDFANDAVISEPYGSGGHGVALYELYMGDATAGPSEELKYQRLMPNDYEELGTVSVRFKDPLGDASDMVSEIIPLDAPATKNACLAYLLYCISEVLRKSDKLNAEDYIFLLDQLQDDKYKTWVVSKQNVVETLVSNIDIDKLKEKAEGVKKREEERIANASGQIKQEPPVNAAPQPMNGMMAFGFPGVNMMQGANGLVDGSGMNYDPSKAPENAGWYCPTCGENRNTGKFCISCGSPKPEWTCICGAVNTGRFCQQCGKPKP